MAKKSLDIFDDPRYLKFVERYQNDPLAFAVEVCGLTPSADQEKLFQAMKPRKAKVSVVSGTGTGKTFVFARIALWHLLCFPSATYDGKIEIGSNTYIGAPNVQQVSDGVWKEMEDAKIAIANSEQHKWLCDYFEITKTKVFIKGYSSQWFISQLALQKGQSVGVAGKHRYWQLIIIDEAAGVSDEHFNVIDGTQTQAGNRTLMASQGVRNAGRFYDSHHRLAKKNGGSWDALVFNSEKSPFVETSWLKEREMEAGGRNTVEYQIRVLGRFAQSSSDYLMTREDLEKGFEPRSIITEDEPYGYLILCDVGLGEYRDDTVIVVAKVYGDGDKGDPVPRKVEYIDVPLCSNDRSVTDLAGDLIELKNQYSNSQIVLDAGGIGAAVYQQLTKKQGEQVIGITWGGPCFKKKFRERFFNQRACAQVRFRDAIRDGRVVFPPRLSWQMREKIIDQGTRLPYHWNESGGLRYQIASKKDMAKAGIKSPDMIDAFSFAFLEQAIFVMADEANTGRDQISDVQKALNLADELFADI